MSARDAIFAAIGGPEPDAPPPPVYEPPRTAAGDLVARFAASLAAAGGELRELAAGASLLDTLSRHPAGRGAERLWSSLREIPARHPGAAPRTHQDLAGLDFALLRGELAVAESGAVWWTPRDALERAAALLAEHVALVVPRTAVVADLHAAYARLDVASARFGCFLCGPSKTADIEQALVVGAHGPRSLEVWLQQG